MRITLSPRTIGEPHWVELNVGDYTQTLDQYYNPRVQRWLPLPWFTKDRVIARFESPNYRRPVTPRAKAQALWTALPKIIKRFLHLK